ncbi:hypothetical protein LZ32DRAFT_57640 [Colletotrichum eremochloae]|nr:hypothetical protein LZ32DRAFT_57640 [Colletotrichum eremochloae]
MTSHYYANRTRYELCSAQQLEHTAKNNNPALDAFGILSPHRLDMVVRSPLWIWHLGAGSLLAFYSIVLGLSFPLSPPFSCITRQCRVSPPRWISFDAHTPHRSCLRR